MGYGNLTEVLVGLYSSGDIRASFACAPKPPGWSDNGKSSALKALQADAR